MGDDFKYDYISVKEFELNKPPFTLHVLITNFRDNRFLEIYYNAKDYSDLPKNINEFLYTKLSFTRFNEFSEFINKLNFDNYLHFEVNLHNRIEHIHKQYLTKKISEIYKN
jgi:hypothetical protein